MMDRRNTVQKELVLKAVLELRNHATAEEIHREILKEHPSVSRGTVYRNLNTLVEEGRIVRVSVPGEADRYDHNTDKHYHIKCLSCGRLYDVHTSPLPSLCDAVDPRDGFSVLSYDVIFQGLCPECSVKEKKEEKENENNR